MTNGSKPPKEKPAPPSDGDKGQDQGTKQSSEK
jgi:hypothetical protein